MTMIESYPAIKCEFCGGSATVTTGGGAAAEFFACDGCREMCDEDAGPENSSEWYPVRGLCKCGEMQDDFGACWKCDAVKS